MINILLMLTDKIITQCVITQKHIHQIYTNTYSTTLYSKHIIHKAHNTILNRVNKQIKKKKNEYTYNNFKRTYCVCKTTESLVSYSLGKHFNNKYNTKYLHT